MLDVFKELIANQFDAALCTLSHCIDRCPDDMWNSRVANNPFCQVAFHTLFFADFYLGPDEHSFRQQEFHRTHERFFGDYEQLEDREPVSLYDRSSIKEYLEFCRTKASGKIAVETTNTLGAPCGFQRRKFSRAELYVYNIRHIQHHAAQLTLRLRLDAKQDFPWIGSGWRDHNFVG
jgi:hypothetical protein